MGVTEYLDTLFGDLGRLITWTFKLFELILGFSYFVGQTCVEWITAIGTGLWYIGVEGWNVIKLTGTELWEFGIGIVKGVLLIYYAVWMVFESFYVITCDLKSFLLHVFITVGEFLHGVQTLVVEYGTKSMSVLPSAVVDGLSFIGDRVLLILKILYIITTHFLTQLVLAPINVIQTTFLFLVKLTDVPFYLWDVYLNTPLPAKAGLIAIIVASIIYWKVNLVSLPGKAWSLLKNIVIALGRLFKVVRNSRRIVQVALTWGGDKEPNNMSDTKALCVVCQEETVSFISIPCKHVCLCYTCVKSLVNVDNRCPLCRGAVTKFERVYIPL